MPAPTRKDLTSMDRQEAIQAVREHYGDYLQEARRMIGGKPSYVCPDPNCKNGTGDDGDGLQPIPRDKGGDGYRLHCFKCGWTGDVIDAYQLANGCDFNTALNELCERFGIEIDGTRADLRPAKAQTRLTTQSDEKRPENVPTTRDFGQYIADCARNLTDPRATAYLQARGLSIETATAYGLGFDAQADPAGTGHKCPRLIIPFSRHSYTARSIDPTTPPKYKAMNPTGSKVEPFNMAALYDDDPRPVFVTEAAIDALSIIEVGGVAIGTNSAGNWRLVAEAAKRKRPRKVLIMAFDDDEAGHRAAKDLKSALDALNVSCTSCTPYNGAKDANEALTSNRAAFAQAIAEAQRQATKPDNVADFMLNHMADEMDALRAQKGRKTGFSNLDNEAGSVYNGLYIVGGISSLGKTTFVAQLCDQMAAQGQHVLFFSLEQSRLEIVSKSIARRTATTDFRSAVTSLQVRMGDFTPAMVEAIRGYTNDIADRVSVIEGNFNCTVGYIREYTARYIEQNGVRPVVIIDYLQVMQPDIDPDTGRKITDKRLAIDYSLTELKRMSRKLEVPVFVVSSVNRTNYLTPIDFESFKESGNIEYTADVVWGLQLTAVNSKEFENDDKGKVKRRKKIAEEKEKDPRDVELVCLKNRYGRCHYKARFEYHPKNDLFIPKAY